MTPHTARQLAARYGVSDRAARGWIADARADTATGDARAHYPVTEVDVAIGSGATRKAWALLLPDAADAPTGVAA